jgi:uncharacterized protein
VIEEGGGKGHQNLLPICHDDAVGSAWGCACLGGMYYQGVGVEKDYGEALKWFRLAAQAGELAAERLLGVWCENGYGVAQDHAEAARWYGKAAGQGDALAQGGLALLHLFGRVVRKDFIEGYKWADLAAAQGDEAAGKNRDKAARLMTPDQVAEAQRRSSAFVARKKNTVTTQLGAR